MILILRDDRPRDQNFLPRGLNKLPDGLCEKSLIERAALVNPAVILGLHRVIVPGASVGLKHEGSVGFQHPSLGLVNGLAERSTGDIRIQLLYKRHRATAPLLTNIHRANEVLHLEPLLQA